MHRELPVRGARPRSFEAWLASDALEKVLAFFPQGFFLRNWNNLAAVSFRHGLAIHPVDPVGIDHQLLFSFQIVKNCHPLRPDDAKSLFLEWMQPAHKDVGFHTVPKLQSTQRGVHNGRIQVTTALSRRKEGVLRPGYTENHGNVVWGKAPQNVLFGTELSEIQARRVDILDFSEMALLDQSVELDDCRVVFENMAQPSAPRLVRSRQFDKLLAFIRI